MCVPTHYNASCTLPLENRIFCFCLLHAGRSTHRGLLFLFVKCSTTTNLQYYHIINYHIRCELAYGGPVEQWARVLIRSLFTSMSRFQPLPFHPNSSSVRLSWWTRKLQENVRLAILRLWYFDNCTSPRAQAYSARLLRYWIPRKRLVRLDDPPPASSDSLQWYLACLNWLFEVVRRSSKFRPTPPPFFSSSSMVVARSPVLVAESEVSSHQLPPPNFPFVRM